MMSWDLSPPETSALKDHDVAPQGQHLQGKKIALLISGSIAAYRTPDLVRDLRREGADVVVFATQESLRYVAKESLEWTSLHKVIDEFTADAEHLSDAFPFDAWLVAPATYSVINKMACGIADSVVTSTLASALGKLERFHKPVLLAPAMHGSMHNSILTKSMEELQQKGVILIPPRQENGKNNLPSNEILTAHTIRALNQSMLKEKSILITGGPTPVPIDHIRRITTHFTGALAIEIAREAWFRGADVRLLLGKGSHTPPVFLQSQMASTFDEYKTRILESLTRQTFHCGIFSAAVADYQPEMIHPGKIPSGTAELSLKLVPTPKVIQLVRQQFPELFMVTFKYEENLSHQALMNIARKRLEQNYNLVVANRGEESGPHGEQVAWLVAPGLEEVSATGKPQIAKALINYLENSL
ncbi:MAG: bifunctional phosphopantothenoylcysteine decarboxylase/phosphopantothenate--cysteine ligase CoaBC [SAR324 cluster bacterium]|nr:bifunctional phosphopantothenoylcysteine decarboxylase/phosphopantothenate--cysteine ligase CoaBC [SAR324 cluster bacterium]